MANKAQRVTVGTSPTRLDVAVEHDYASGQHFLARNRATSESMFVGGADVTTTTGFEIRADETFVDDLGNGDAVYGVSVSGTVLCHVFQAGV